ncbi:nucleotide sugar dehydrogenase [Streptomyces sp. NPDC053560]|uniref:nucleotide sugar dehydrogenase n=1 Tax=Streptomyces sp. NPDC053560 TaxID=3365711 RepID=UPI0037CDCBF7
MHDDTRSQRPAPETRAAARTPVLAPPDAPETADGPNVPAQQPAHRCATVAVVGLGYVGLPMALALRAAGTAVVGIDTSAPRLRQIRAGEADLLPEQRHALRTAVTEPGFRLTAEPAAVSGADAVIICVPTPVDRHLVPDLGALSAACASVVAHAVPGQLLMLTSTSYVGTTRDLLVEPLARRGLRAGTDVFVASAPERIDPGDTGHTPDRTPRVVGGAGPRSTELAAALLARTAPAVHRVDSPEAAEMSKLWENTFRAVNIALANELADHCLDLGLAPLSVIEAAATKPYGFMPFYPGPGVGGHCIPCDPHYLLWQLRGRRAASPLVDTAMTAIAGRPAQMAGRALAALAARGLPAAGARVLLVGVTYKAAVADVRESPALEIMDRLAAAGARVAYADPLVPSLERNGTVLHSVEPATGGDWDLVIVHTVHPGTDLAWLAGSTVLDATHRLPAARAEAAGAAG